MPGLVRTAAAAGLFYPASPAVLAATLDRLLAAAAAAPDLHLAALIAPHAGYAYSGAVAARAYARLRGRLIARAIVIAPSHYESFSFASVFEGVAYETPLGSVPIDREVSDAIAAHAGLRSSARGHAPSREHALEVQLPFLQRVLGGFTLVAVVLGSQTPEIVRAVAAAIAPYAAPDTIVVASSDLSHFHRYDAAVALDHRTIETILAGDADGLLEQCQRRTLEACGAGPVAAALLTARRAGAMGAELLGYANSGDVTGHRHEVVGYAAIALRRL